MSRMSLIGMALTAAAVGCGENFTSPNSPLVNQAQARFVLQALSPINSEGIVGTSLEYGPTVQVKDGAGNPLANVVVKFTLLAEEPGAQVGWIANSEALTNALGVAAAGEWTLSSKAGPNSLQASIVGAAPLAFRADARPDAPVSLGWLARMEGEVALAGMAVQPPHVQAWDHFGNSVAGIPVTFAITEGDGTLEGATMLTTDDGVSALRWTLGPYLGANTITASAAGLESIHFTVHAIEASAIYDFTMVDGGIGWDVASGFVAFTADGRFVSHTKYSDGWLWATSGTYVILGSTVVFTYDTGDEELGSLVNGVLVLDRWDNPCVPTRRFHYRLRS